MGLIEASVLMPVFNRSAMLLDVLADLRQQEGVRFEVVVVDDGSAPPLAGDVDPAHYPYPLVLLRNDANRGIGFSRNRAAAAARGALLVWLDSDCRVDDPGWLAAHLQTHRQGLPALGVAPGQAFVLHSGVTGNNTNYAGRSFMYSNLFASCFPRPTRVRDHHFPTMNLSMPRALFEAVGPFDGALQVAEDIDWCLRALALGVPLIFVPGIHVRHQDRASLLEVWQSFRRMGGYAYEVRMKNPAAPYSWLYPSHAWQARIMALPLATLLTIYITARWLRVSPGVLLCLPGMVLANVAYALGVLDGAKAAASPDTNTP